MGAFGRLHTVPVGVLGEENSAPQYVRALLVQKNGVGFLDLVEGDEIEPDAGDAKDHKREWMQGWKQENILYIAKPRVECKPTNLRFDSLDVASCLDTATSFLQTNQWAMRREDL